MASATDYPMTVDFTTWNSQKVDTGSEVSFAADGSTGSDVTFCFNTSDKSFFSSGFVFRGVYSSSPSATNYIKVSVPAGYSVDVTGIRGSSTTRYFTASFTLGTVGQNFNETEVTTKTLTNNTETDKDLYLFTPKNDEGVLKQIVIYNPSTHPRHNYTVNYVDANDATLKTLASGRLFEGEEYSYSLVKVYTDGSGNYYELDDSESRTNFKETKTMGTADVTQKYLYRLNTNIVYYKECTGNVNAEATGPRTSHSHFICTTQELPIGNYELTMRVYKYGDGRNMAIQVGGSNVRTSSAVGLLSFPITLTSASTITVVANSESGLSNDIDYVMVKRVSQSISAVDNLGYTYSSTWPLDFTSSDIHAYIAQYTSGDVVTLHEVTKVPANTGLFIKGITGSVNVLAVGETTDDVSGNVLVAQTATGTVYQTTEDKTNYVLGLVGETPTFLKVPTSGVEIAAGKAYLSIDYLAAAARLNIIMYDETTGINAVNSEQLIVKRTVYNLNGQRVIQPKKGLYILNGKKIFIK